MLGLLMMPSDLIRRVEVQQFYQLMRDKAESTLQGGRTIGNYVVTRNLGEGTFGKVKLGIHSITGERVAVKVLEKSRIADVADVERVTREIHILKQIRHPNVIQLYEIIETPKQLFLVMEYVSEGELFELIVKKKRLKQPEACEFFRQLIAGVEYLHQLGIVHRDLKPQNLLIDFNRTLKLVDFGLSNTYKQKDMLKTACGSPCYAAPEMIAGKKYLGLNADIWSCGVVLFAMVCGYLPFEDPNTTLLYKKIIAGDYTMPKFVSAQARDLIQGLLTTDPERRLKLRDIKTHPWFTQACEGPIRSVVGIKVGQQSIPVDPLLLAQMGEYNQDPEETRKYIENNRHNHSITIYYLLLKKQLRNGTQSAYDLCSTAFNPQLLVKKAQPEQPKLEKERSESTNTNDLEEIQLESMTAPIAPVPRSNRIISRLSHLRDKQSRKREDSIQPKIDLQNLPTVAKAGTGQQKKRVHQIILSKESKEPPEEISLYDIDQRPFANKFHQTITTGWRRPGPASFRASINKSQQRDRDEKREIVRQQRRQERAASERYRSVQIGEREASPNEGPMALMNKTFMGKIPKAYIPRWENESERIRSILNTTISGHGKRKHKFNFFY